VSAVTKPAIWDLCARCADAVVVIVVPLCIFEALTTAMVPLCATCCGFLLTAFSVHSRLLLLPVLS
jgi:hypothetical protein